jgi:hypothetical protein
VRDLLISYYIIELENGKFARIEYEGGSHVGIYEVKDHSYATRYDELKELNELLNDLEAFHTYGFGFEKHNSEYQYHGKCIKVKRKREIEIVLK